MIKVRRSSREVMMSKLWRIAQATIAGAIALLVTTAFSTAQDANWPLTPTPKPHIIAKKHVVRTPARRTAAAQTKKPTALALAAAAPAPKEEHRLILQVN